MVFRRTLFLFQKINEEIIDRMMGMITSKADRTCFCRGIALIFHLHTSSPPCPFRVLCARIPSACAQKQEQCSPAQLLLLSSSKSPKKAEQKKSKTSKSSTSCPAIYCSLIHTITTGPGCAGACSAVRPEAVADPSLFPGHQRQWGALPAPRASGCLYCSQNSRGTHSAGQC